MKEMIFTILETWLAREHSVVEIIFGGYLVCLCMGVIYVNVFPRRNIWVVFEKFVEVIFYLLSFVYFYILIQVILNSLLHGDYKGAILGGVMLVCIVVVPAIPFKITEYFREKKHQKEWDERYKVQKEKQQPSLQHQVDKEALEIHRKIIEKLQAENKELVLQKRRLNMELLALREEYETMK